jgi:hypothetical protein
MIKVTRGNEHGSKSCYTCDKGGIYDVKAGKIIDVPTDLNTLRIGGRQNVNAMTMCYCCLRELENTLLDFFNSL